MGYEFKNVTEIKNGEEITTLMVVEKTDHTSEVVTPYAAKLASLEELAKPKLEAAKATWESEQPEAIDTLETPEPEPTSVGRARKKVNEPTPA